MRAAEVNPRAKRGQSPFTPRTAQKGTGPRRPGYTLIELIVALGTGAILMAGLSSALYMSTRGLTPDVTATSDASRSSLALSQVTSDLRLALNFSERTASAVTFTVPDRNSDGSVETIRYSWAGTGNPLLYQYNGGTAVTIAANVTQFNLTSLIRSIPATSCVLPATIVAYAPVSEQKISTGSTGMTIGKPVGLVPGNLMVAAVAIKGASATTMTAPAGWTLIQRQDDGSTVSFAAWWKIAGASEPANHTFSWTGTRRAYGWIMRFSGVETTAPINAWNSLAGGAILAAPSPAVTSTVDDAMIVRMGGFDDASMSGDNANVPSHTTLTADNCNGASTGVSGAAAYTTQATAGSSGSTTFTLLSIEKYVTITIALRPDDGI